MRIQLWSPDSINSIWQINNRKLLVPLTVSHKHKEWRIRSADIKKVKNWLPSMFTTHQDPLQLISVTCIWFDFRCNSWEMWAISSPLHSRDHQYQTLHLSSRFLSQSRGVLFSLLLFSSSVSLPRRVTQKEERKDVSGIWWGYWAEGETSLCRGDWGKMSNFSYLGSLYQGNYSFVTN